MKTAIIVILIIIFVLVLLFLAMLVFLASYVSMPKSSLKSSREWEEQHGFWRDFDKYETKDYIIKSFDGYELHTFFVPNKQFPDSRKFVIITHGFTSSRYGALKYMFSWHSLGYQCVIYDDRHHGANKKGFFNPCTLGMLESKDLMAVINDTYERYGKDIYLGLQGESMGSATQINALAYKPKVHFMVCDCGFSDLFNVLKVGICDIFKLPAWIIYPASVVNRILYRWDFFKDRPIDCLKGNTIPICFVHGADDDFIVCENSKRMAEANPSYTELHLFPNAKHAESMYSDEKTYYSMLESFLKKVVDNEKVL
jgi:pimeloyl-ACP methyl ester carboxylesterase